MGLYPDTIKSVLDACHRYRRQEMTLDDYKAVIWEASTKIIALEEKSLRKFLQRAEAELDLIQFTNDEIDIFGRTLAVVEHIEKELAHKQRPA